MMLTKIDGFHASKIRFGKTTVANHLKKRKMPKKTGFWGKSGDRISMVAGDHGPRSLATMGFLSPFGCHFSVVFRSFSILFSSVFFLTFFLIYWFDSLEENLSRSRANQSTKFPIFGKNEDFVTDFRPRVETRSKDVE